MFDVSLSNLLSANLFSPWGVVISLMLNKIKVIWKLDLILYLETNKTNNPFYQRLFTKKFSRKKKKRKKKRKKNIKYQKIIPFDTKYLFAEWPVWIYLACRV